MREGLPNYSLALKISVHQSKSIHLGDIENNSLKTATGSVGMLKGVVKENPVISSHRPLMFHFIRSLIFAPYGVYKLSLWYGKYRSFRVDFGCSSAIKPVDSSTIGNSIWGYNGDMGRGEALAKDTAIKCIYVLIPQSQCPVVPCLVSS